MKKAHTYVFALVIFSMALIIYSKKDATTTEVTPEISTVTQVETTETLDPAVIDMESFVNDKTYDKPVVEIWGDNGPLFSFDFSKMAITKVEVTLDEPVEKGYLYVTMAGGIVTNHSLSSDGSLFAGIADIVDGKAEFTVEYDETKMITFTINVQG